MVITILFCKLSYKNSTFENLVKKKISMTKINILNILKFKDKKWNSFRVQQEHDSTGIKLVFTPRGQRFNPPPHLL